MSVSQDKISIYTDGGSRGNPGPAAAGYIILEKSGKQLDAAGLYLGEATNNFAEYTAVIKALENARKFNPKTVNLYSDSELLVKQLNGEYKVKSDQLRPLFEQALELLGGFENYSVKHIPREKNKKADELVNKALDLRRNFIPKSAKSGQKRKPLKLGVLISGGGRTLLNIIDCIKKGQINAEVSVVICSLLTAAGVERAKNAGLNVKIVRKKDFTNIDDFSRRLEEELAAAEVDLVIQGGWLCLWKIPERYKNKVLNIHPALLPSFGGQGMWGHHVHEAVLKAGCKVSGCTVHICTNEYDKGPIIVQRCCPVKENDTPDTLAERVFEEECIAYPCAINLFEQGCVKIEDDKIVIKE